jgi:hypothetical protein
VIDQDRKFETSAALKSEPTVKPLTTERLSCAATNKRGLPCGAHAMAGAEHCWVHNPDVPQDTKLAAFTRGGLHATRATRMPTDAHDPSLQTPAEVTRYLEGLAGRLERGELPSRVGSSLVSLAAAALKAHEMNIAQRLAELEELVASRAKTPVPYGLRVLPAGESS